MLKPCPVDIDTGEVSVLERQILADWGYKHTAAATRLTLRYLENRSPIVNKVFRTAVLRVGVAASSSAASWPRLSSRRAAPLRRFFCGFFARP